VQNAVELLLGVAEKHMDAEFVHFLYQETDGGWQPDEQIPEIAVRTNVPDFFQYLYDLGGVAASACTKLFRRDLINSLRFTEGINHEDEELMTRLLPRCCKVVYTNLVLYGYVMRQGSIIHSGFSPKTMDIFSIMDARIQALQELKCTDLVVETRCRMFRTAAWQYCLARKDGFKTEAGKLKRRILEDAKEKNLPLSGQYRVLYQLAGKIPGVVDLYYFARKLSGK
jgi:hypothetical protein